ncbi:MAG: hypothetical protein ACJAZS_000185 [Alteromonas naphthalenivorans]|jgi:hypothetical protein
MTLLLILKSFALGSITGCIYGFLLTRKMSAFAHGPTDSVKSNFVSFFFIALARIFFIAFLWNYILRRTSLNIILVLVSFLASFWAVVIKKKVLNE